MNRFVAPLLLMCALFVVGQSPPELSSEQKVSLLQAQHKLDETQKQMKDMDLQFQQLQAQVKAQYEKLQQQETKQKADLDAAITEAFKAAKTEQSKYDLDLESMTFKAKPTKAEAKPPDKK